MGGGRRQVSRGRIDSSRRADLALLGAVNTCLPRTLRAWSRKVRERSAMASAICPNPLTWASLSRAVRSFLPVAPAAAPDERVPDEAAVKRVPDEAAAERAPDEATAERVPDEARAERVPDEAVLAEWGVVGAA